MDSARMFPPGLPQTPSRWNRYHDPATWPAPVTGSYSLKLTVVDSSGKTATATIPVTITAK